MPKPQRANVDRLSALMDEHELDAVVVRAGHNVTYLSGIVYPGTLARHLDMSDSRRGVLVVWPRHAEPVVIYDSIAAGPSERDSCISKHHVFDGFNDDCFTALVTVLSTLGLTDARVGFESNLVGHADWVFVQSQLPALQMKDCTATLDQTRWIKTAEEVELLRAGARVLDECYLDVLPQTRPGDTERDVHARLIAGCIERGANWAHGILNSSRNNIIYCGESDAQFASGDVLRTDYVAYVDGYPGHQNRNAVMGKPTAEQERTYAKYRSLYLATINRLRPGVRVSDIFRETVESFHRAGWDYQAGLIGHSVGPWWHQQAPILTRTCDTILEQGMVLAIEPFVEYWHTQDMVLLTAHGAEILSTHFDTSGLLVIE